MSSLTESIALGSGLEGPIQNKQVTENAAQWPGEASYDMSDLSVYLCPIQAVDYCLVQARIILIRI